MNFVFINNKFQLSMIQKSRVYPEYTYPPQKFQIDHFHNPYLAKLNIKLTPHTNNSAKYQFISPISANNNLYVSQVIPLYKNQKVRFALLWRHYLTNKFARSHFGVSFQYKIFEEMRIKSRFLTGTTSILDLQASKFHSNGVETFIGYSGFAQTTSIFSSFSVGIRKGGYSAMLTKKVNAQTQWRVSANSQIAKNIFVQASCNGNVNDPQKGNVQLSISQVITSNTNASLGIVCNPYYKEIGFKVQVQRFVTKHQKILVSTELSEGKSIFYLGFKNLNFNFVFPFFIMDSPIPVLLGIAAYGAAFLLKKRFGSKVQVKEQGLSIKTEEKRQQQLKLISDRAADHYQKQKINRNGLIIEQSYMGPAQQIQEFMNDPNRFTLILRNEQYKQKFVDLTITFRFYVMKGELKLRKGDKSSLLGFYRRDATHNRIGVRYTRGIESTVEYFDYLDPIVLSIPK